MWVSSEMKALADMCVSFDDFPPGHYFDSRTGQLVRWYQPEWHDELRVPEDKLDLPRLREGLEAAVKRQLMSDVPYVAAQQGTAWPGAKREGGRREMGWGQGDVRARSRSDLPKADGIRLFAAHDAGWLGVIAERILGLILCWRVLSAFSSLRLFAGTASFCLVVWIPP
jgi:hypothetical protein